MSAIGDFRIAVSILEAAELSFLLAVAMASRATKITSALSSGVRYFLKNCRKKEDRSLCSGPGQPPGARRSPASIRTVTGSSGPGWNTGQTT